MAKTYECPKCKDACHVFPYEDKLVLKCFTCGAREITKEEHRELETKWKKGNE